MTARLFSILRRKPGLIDFVTPALAASTGVVGYRLKTDTSPTGSFSTTVITAPRNGYLDPALAGVHSVIQPGDNVRIVLKPGDFGLSDTAAFWLKLFYVDASNAELGSPAPSAATLVLPPYTGQSVTGFSATAPLSSTQIDLPRAMENFRVSNLDNSKDLMIITQDGGPEITVAAGKDFVNYNGIVSSIWVRGNGGTVNFSATFSYANPR